MPSNNGPHRMTNPITHSVSEQRINELVSRITFRFEQPQGTTTTLAHAFLDDEFYLASGFSGCVDKAKFNAAVGEKNAGRDALAKARNKLWELEGYALRLRLTGDGEVCSGAGLCSGSVGCADEQPITDSVSLAYCAKELLLVCDPNAKALAHRMLDASGAIVAGMIPKANDCELAPQPQHGRAPSMGYFVSSKIVKAFPMSRSDYNQYRGWKLPTNENGDDAGYLVEYLDGGETNHPNHAGYISWSPAEVFCRSNVAIGDVGELPPHVQRVAAERAQLSDRLGRLAGFIAGDSFNGLPEGERQRLFRQHALMEELESVLAERIANA